METYYNPPDIGIGTVNTQYAYNLDRQITTITRPDGQTISFDYDNGGRLSAITVPARQINYAYNATTGNLSSISTSSETLTFSHDGSLLTGQSWSGTISGSVAFVYNNDFRVTTETVNGANSVSYAYDNDGLLTGAGGLTISRDAQNGLITGTTIGSVTTSKGYNTYGEPNHYTANVSGAPVFDVQYTRDNAGRITSKIETTNGVTSTYDYGYDATGRLIEVRKNGALTVSYGYDDNGNRVTVNGATVGVYDNQDRLTAYGNTSYSYTANGELQGKTSNGQTTQYSYDVLGSLKSAVLPDGTQIQYVVDGQNRRIGKKVNGSLVQAFLYEDQLRPVAELDGSGNIVSRFVYGTKVNVPEYMVKNGVTYRIITDHLGSPRLVVDAGSGAIVQQIEHDEFGNVLADTNPGFQPFGFAGGIYDQHTRLTRFGARDYDAETGKWTAKDPIRFNGGDVNLYGYVLNDPVRLIDPFGLDSLVADHGTLTHYNDSGNVVGTYPYTTGQDGVNDPSVPWNGPIPPGNYSLDPSQISEGGFLRDILGDWGKYRVPLTPDSSTNTYGRSGFFLHGGKKPGSAGCIDIGSGDKSLFPILKGHNGPISVVVK